jgi:hypothetical protein
VCPNRVAFRGRVLTCKPHNRFIQTQCQSPVGTALSSSLRSSFLTIGQLQFTLRGLSFHLSHGILVCDADLCESRWGFCASHPAITGADVDKRMLVKKVRGHDGGWLARVPHTKLYIFDFATSPPNSVSVFSHLAKQAAHFGACSTASTQR